LFLERQEGSVSAHQHVQSPTSDIYMGKEGNTSEPLGIGS